MSCLWYFFFYSGDYYERILNLHLLYKRIETFIHKRLGYRIFSIKRPQRLFKTWPQGPGVYLKPAFNRGPAFINEVKFSSFLG